MYSPISHMYMSLKNAIKPGNPRKISPLPSTTRLVCAFQTEGGYSIYNSHLFLTMWPSFHLLHVCLP